MTNSVNSQIRPGLVQELTVSVNKQIAEELLDQMPQDEWLTSHRDKIISICGYNGFDAPMVAELLKIMEK